YFFLPQTSLCERLACILNAFGAVDVIWTRNAPLKYTGTLSGPEQGGFSVCWSVLAKTQFAAAAEPCGGLLPLPARTSGMRERNRGWAQSPPIAAVTYSDPLEHRNHPRKQSCHLRNPDRAFGLDG